MGKSVNPVRSVLMVQRSISIMTLYTQTLWWCYGCYNLAHDNVMKWIYFPHYWPCVRGTTGHLWIPLTKASDAELWCFLWSLPFSKHRNAGDSKRHRSHYDVTVMWNIYDDFLQQQPGPNCHYERFQDKTLCLWENTSWICELFKPPDRWAKGFFDSLSQQLIFFCFD